MWKKRNLRRASIVFMGLGVVLTVLKEEIDAPLLYHLLKDKGTFVRTKPPTNNNPQGIFIPASLSIERQRALSIHLGGGECQWQPPAYEVPETIDFHKTVIAGFPSGDKRIAYLQMEALTGWPTKDEWDFAYLGASNHPFIKANYPHHEGIWGWGAAADQVILVVPNIRRAMVEYHDILWDIGYAKTWEEAFQKSDNLYGELPPLEDYYAWRDARVEDEAHWYGWLIDYWMEGGLLRDVFTHKLTTQEHWEALLLKFHFSRAELDYNVYVGADTIVPPTYDPHCTDMNLVTGGCEPVAVVSADTLRDYTEGPGETTAIATALMRDTKMGQYVIDPLAWDCIWNELVENKKGPKTIYDRPGGNQGAINEYNFSAVMLQAMIEELNRLIGKYAGPPWNEKPTAVRLVQILSVHLADIQQELVEVETGVRKLKEKDFLGTTERDTANDSTSQAEGETESATIFNKLEQKEIEEKRVLAQVEAKTKEKEWESGSPLSDREFTALLSNAVSQIRSLHGAGGMARDTAVGLMERIKKVAAEAKLLYDTPKRG